MREHNWAKSGCNRRDIQPSLKSEGWKVHYTETGRMGGVENRVWEDLPGSVIEKLWDSHLGETPSFNPPYDSLQIMKQKTVCFIDLFKT